MVVREVLLLGNPKLRDKSTRVANPKAISHVYIDLRDTLHHHQQLTGSGRGIAAPQIGYFQQVVYVETPEFTSFMVNPEISEKSEEMFQVWDGCLCFKGAFFVKIPRHRRITVDYLDEEGQPHTREFEGTFSELMQHEIDHLHGILAIDHLEDPKNIIMREELKKQQA
jgi:peptide deformylase